MLTELDGCSVAMQWVLKGPSLWREGMTLLDVMREKLQQAFEVTDQNQYDIAAIQELERRIREASSIPIAA